MKPIIKYQGGKRRELPLIDIIKPSSFSRIVEPFCGGAAVSLHYGDFCVLNDINPIVTNLYQVVQSDEFVELLNQINVIKTYDHDQLQNAYYIARDVINNQSQFSPLVKAISYVIVRQLCFSGMERYNVNSGKFNVPFGHYKKMSCVLSPDHHTFFKNKVTVSNRDAIDVINECNSDDWIFLDPPYLDRLGYSTGDGSDGLHTRLVEAMKTTKAKWLFIHSDCEFYRDSLSEFDIQTKSFRYAQNFGKGKDHSGAKVEHIYVKNY
jgi:DNA adenine methylase